MKTSTASAPLLLCLLITLAAPLAQADNPCLDEEEQKRTKAELARIAQAEKSGKPAELFMAYRAGLSNFCLDDAQKGATAKMRSTIPKLGKELAAAAEAKGLLYSAADLRTDGTTSAFRYYEAIGEFLEANRVMLKAVKHSPDDVTLFEAAWNVDGQRQYARDPNTGDPKPFTSPSSYRQELERSAAAAADRLLKAEDKDAAGLTGNMTVLATAAASSMTKLEQAATWLKHTSGGDKPVRLRAEQRGDMIMKRGDPMFSQPMAVAYYKFARSPKAKQIEAKQEERQRAIEKSAESMKRSMDGMVKEKSAADQEKFKKGKADLEKELGF